MEASKNLQNMKKLDDSWNASSQSQSSSLLWSLSRFCPTRLNRLVSIGKPFAHRHP